MSDYETQVKKWAAKKLKINRANIENVYLDVMTRDSGCDTCGSFTEFDAFVTLKEGKSKRIDLSAEAYGYADRFPAILKEIIEA